MTTRIYPIMIFLMLLASCANSEKYNSLKEDNIKGQVRSIVETEFSINLNNFKTIRSVSESNYNELGYIISLKFTDNNPQFNGDFVKIFSYDDNNNIAGVKFDGVNEDVALHQSVQPFDDVYKYNYNSKGRIVKKTILSRGSKNDTRPVLSRDNMNDENTEVNIQPKKRNLIFNKSKPNSYYEYKYDEQGNLLEEVFNNGYSRVYKTIFKYDGNGKKIEEVFLDSQDQLITKTLYGRDNYDRIVFKKDIYPDTLYNQTIKYKYNRYSDVIEELRDKDLHKYIYEYDKNQNWVSKSEFLNQRQVSNTIRAIVYY